MTMGGDGDFLSYMRGPSPSIPGLTGSDVLEGSIGQGKNGHSLYEDRTEADRERLRDPDLLARVAFWLRPGAFSLKEVKTECKSRGAPVTGNKRVLALRLAFEELPADVEESLAGGYAIAECSPHKRGGKRVRMGAKSTGGAKAKKRKAGGSENVAKIANKTVQA